MKTWIAYMIPRYDMQALFEDGIGYIEAGDSKEEATNKLEASFLDSLGGEQNAEFWEIRLSENKLHVQEIEETSEDTEKTTRLVRLAIRWHEEVECPSLAEQTGFFECLATRDELTLEAMLKINKGGQQ